MKKRNGLREFERAVDRSAAAVAEVHKQVLNMPFAVIEQFESIAAPARKVRAFQEQVVDGIYESIRRVNKVVFDAAESLIGTRTERASKRVASRPKPRAVPRGRALATAR